MIEIKKINPVGAANGTLTCKGTVMVMVMTSSAVVEVQRFLTFREANVVSVMVEYNNIKNKTSQKKKSATVTFSEMFA